MTTSRRNFLTGLASFVAAAPAVVKAANIMPIKAILNFEELPFNYQALYNEVSLGYAITRKAIDENLYSNAFPLDAKTIEIYAANSEVNWNRLLQDTNISTIRLLAH